MEHFDLTKVIVRHSNEESQKGSRPGGKLRTTMLRGGIKCSHERNVFCHCIYINFANTTIRNKFFQRQECLVRVSVATARNVFIKH
jgi:hypothetical protein